METVYLACRENASVKAASRFPYCLTAAASSRKGSFLCMAAALPHNKHTAAPQALSSVLWWAGAPQFRWVEVGNPFLALFMGLCNTFLKVAIIFVKILSITHQELSPPLSLAHPCSGQAISPSLPSACKPLVLCYSCSKKRHCPQSRMKAWEIRFTPSPTDNRGAHPKSIIVLGCFSSQQRDAGTPGGAGTPQPPRALPATLLHLLCSCTSQCQVQEHHVEQRTVCLQ